MKKLFVVVLTVCLLSCTAVVSPAWAAPGRGSLTIVFDDHITKVVGSDFEFTTSGQSFMTLGDGGGTYQFEVSLENGYVIDEVLSSNIENPIGLVSSSFFYVSDSFSGPLSCTITITSRLAESYTVHFDDWDGTVLKSEIVTEGSAATAPSAPAREGYTFIGWDKPFDNVTGDLTVTATYEKSEPEPETYSVTFQDWDGTVLKTEIVTEGSAATAPSDPFRDGYTFTGWDNPFDAVTENLTVTAQYIQNSEPEPEPEPKPDPSCETCGGTGTVQISCRSCEGTGHMTCEFCEGRGWFLVALPTEDKQEECPNCAGSGTLSCTVCNGCGELTIPCPICFGGEIPEPPDNSDSQEQPASGFDFKTWWSERTTAEQWILGIAGGLLILAVMKGLFR